MVSKPEGARMRGAWLAVFIFCGFPVTVAALEPYYGKKLADHSPQMEAASLRTLLFEVLSQVHVAKPGQPDELVSTCPPRASCLSQKSLGYEGARKVLFGQLYLLSQDNRYAVADVYCRRLLTEQDFPRGKGPGPGQIPDNNVVNAEHAWPQSLFSNQFPKDLQKSDLHILFSTSAKANSLRGNQPFGDVISSVKSVCSESKLGYTSRGNINSFLPPENIRGDVARALFYFSVRYKMKIDLEQESTLRSWHDHDPVDQEESERHAVKFDLTHIRNPFIDHPEWVDQIADF